jgi:hypothetical protein
VLSPAPVLALLVGVFWSAAYVAIRGSAGGRLPLVVLAAALGAWAGDAIGTRLGIGLLALGDFHLVTASLVAWLGIAFVTIVSVLGPTGRRTS